MKLFLSEPFASLWQDKDPFREAFGIDGENYRDMGDRKTARFEIKGKGYFIKTHSGVGVGEILKNLVYLRLPVLGASNEYQAINRLQELGISSMTAVAFGQKGMNPATRQSFLITEALEPAEPLDEFLNPSILKSMGMRERRNLVRKLAEITRTLHANGLNHRDYYLCHFLLDCSESQLQQSISQRPLYLIDLHRVQIRNRTPGRWRRKDIAALFYSAKMVGFTKRDAICFIREYDKKPLTASLKNQAFWQKIVNEADKLFKKGQRKGYHE